MTNPSESAESEYSASIRMSVPLVDKIMEQSHETPDDADVRRLMYAVRKEDLKGKLEELKDLSKREFRDALRLRYDWPIPDSPSVCVCCDCSFTMDHAMMC